MSVVDIILFVASSSKICEALLKFIKTSEIPARIVRLDSEEIRKAVCNGKYFKITVVPTMVVVYEDDNIQLYEGMEKIVKWIKLLLQAQKEPKPEPEQYQPEPMIKEQKQELIGKKEQNIQEIEVITRIPNEDEPEEIAEPVMVEQKKKKGRKGKKKILTFEDDKPADYQPRQYNLPKSKPSKMNALYDMAKQMEKDRQSSLGYKEEDLPKYR